MAKDRRTGVPPRVDRKPAETLRNIAGFLISACLLLVLLCTPARAEQVVLPMTLDFKLLTSLVVGEAFTGRNNSAAIVGRPGECMYLGISEPKLSSAGKHVRMDMRLVIRLGTELAGECLVPVEWQGYLSLLQQPVFDSRTFTLAFRTIDSSLYTLSRQPAAIAGVLWEFAKPRVYEHISRLRLNLAPPVRDMRDFLAPLFHDQARRATQAMLDSLHGRNLTVTQDGVIVQLQAEVEDVYVPETDPFEKIIDPEGRKRLIRLWETWDVFLVRLIALIASEPLTPEDQLLLVDVLLDTRHAFAAALEEQDLEKDFVRVQFVRVWRTLAPLFRRQLYAKPSENILGYLAFFTAADALLVFDQMGPTLGIEVSEQGLLRLATMLTGTQTSLPYTLEVDAGLRKLLQLPPVESPPPPDEEEILEIDLPRQPKEGDPLSRLSRFIFAPAYAASIPPFAEILEWKVPEDDVDGYVERVRNVLAEATAATIAKQQLPENLQGMFRTMIIAMAWQESCFRQFVEKGDKLTFLLSYNQTSVGVMQINERVWRGLYDRNQLRWDIRYNALAGCEIAELYLRRYALQGKALKSGAKNSLLPGVVYAMYNGGPGQKEKYLAREKSGKTFASDQHFAEKLKWVEQRDWGQIRECLGGS